MGDLIGEFLSFAEPIPSPQLFKLWSGISLISSVLERRVWTRTNRGTSYANLYLLLVADPGIGKKVISSVRDLWEDSIEPGTHKPAFHVAPDSMTKASLIDTLAKAQQTKIMPKGPPLIYHSLLTAAEEFGVLLPAYDDEYIGVLNGIWINKRLHHEVRRTSNPKEVSILNPQLSLLGGYQPSMLATKFPESAWASGLARRLIMIYAAETPYIPMFGDISDTTGYRISLLAKLGFLSQVHGEMFWNPDAAKEIENWDLAGGPPRPTHSRLVGFLNSRTEIITRLVITSAIARDPMNRTIAKEDVERSIYWLLGAEKVMPDIFRAMKGKSDIDIINELHYFVTTSWAKNKRGSVSLKDIYQFIYARAPHEKAMGLINAAINSNVIKPLPGKSDEFLPVPREEHQVE